MLSLIRVSIAATLFALPLIVALDTPAYACSCAPPDLEQQVAEADAIVIGTPVDREIVEPVPTPEPSSPPGLVMPISVDVDTTLSVEEYLKGAGGSTLIVRTDGEIYDYGPGEPELLEGLSPSCSYVPELGAEYLFFLHRRDDGELTAHPCSGIYSANDAETIAEIRGLLQQDATATAPPDATATVAAEELPPAGSAGRATGDAPLAAIAIGGALAAATLLSGFGWRLLRR
jgi:hypothetical protein